MLYGPSNIAEITFNKHAVDYYDVSTIAGFNVPMSFGPTNFNDSLLDVCTSIFFGYSRGGVNRLRGLLHGPRAEKGPPGRPSGRCGEISHATR